MSAISTYECLLLVDADLGRDKVEAAQKKVESVLAKGGGEVALWDNWGERRLAYPIKKKTRAVYSLGYIRGSAEARNELSRTLKLTEEILRFMIIKPFNEPDLAAIAAKREAKAEQAVRNEPASREPSSDDEGSDDSGEQGGE